MWQSKPVLGVLGRTRTITVQVLHSVHVLDWYRSIRIYAYWYYLPCYLHIDRVDLLYQYNVLITRSTVLYIVRT